MIGLPIGQAFTLTDELPFRARPRHDLEAALDQAYRTRPDYQAALERVSAAEAERRAVTGELLPSVHVNADYGALGLTPGDSHATYALVGSVTVPIFNGGRTKGRLIDADAELRTRRAEADDLKASIYYDVKTAFLDLQATSEQLQVATRSRDLAAQQLVAGARSIRCRRHQQRRSRSGAGGGRRVERAVHRRALRLQRREGAARARSRRRGGRARVNISEAFANGRSA